MRYAAAMLVCLAVGCDSTPAAKVTTAHYDQIQEGMTYEEVVDLIGFEGEPMLQFDMKAGSAAAYAWKNSDESMLFVNFENGKVTQKTAAALPRP